MTHYAEWRRPMAEDVIVAQVPLSVATVAGRSEWLPAGSRLTRAGYFPELQQWVALADVAGMVGVLVRFDAPDRDRWYEPWNYDDEPEPADPTYEWTTG